MVSPEPLVHCLSRSLAALAGCLTFSYTVRSQQIVRLQVDANIPTGTIFGVYEETESMENCFIGKAV